MLETLKILSPALTEPSFRNMLVVAAGWLLTRGRHAVTESLVQTRVSGVRSHEIFHRFFSRASWSIDEMGKLVFLATRPLRGETPRIVVDDTVARGKGPHVFGLGCHLDASRSTRRFKVLCFGHCWVMLTVNVTLPFSSRIWSLPLLFRLYRNESICKKNSVDYKTKNELAIELRQVFLSWLPKDQRVEMLGDSAYACRALLKKKPKNLVFIGAAISTARFRRLPPKQHKRSKKGRPYRYGPAFPKLARMASASRGWETAELQLYGETRTVTYRSFVAFWPTVCGTQPIKIVLVKCTTGLQTFRVYFSTDTAMTAEQILTAYSQRWSIEVCFRDLKQHLGFGDSSARSEQAVLRTAPFVGILYSCLVLRFARSPKQAQSLVTPERPWYPNKKEPSTLDLLRQAARELDAHDFRAEAKQRRLRRKVKTPHARQRSQRSPASTRAAA